jgi:hypothetical protein
MSTAPWWATGVFTLSGVLIAQLLTYAVSRNRDRFEDSRRWHEDRRDIYLDIVTSAWEIEEAVFDHFEQSVALPPRRKLTAALSTLGLASRKTQLIGSEEVKELAQRLRIEAGVALDSASHDDSGRALDACDNIRHTAYYLTDLMRAELTSNPAAVRSWHRRRRVQRWLARRRRSRSRSAS